MRKARAERKTKEVEVSVSIDLDGGDYEVGTGIPFFNHMLETFAKHAGIGLKLKARGDIEVDEHHTIEDVAIALGEAIKTALGDKKGIARFGDAILPMDDAVAMCGVDVSGRGYFNFEGSVGDVKGMKAENFVHFFDTLCRNAGINVYLQLKGMNAHHTMEAAFKAFAKAFSEAIEIRGEDVRSTKGVL
ncbi:Imidazoleglycerol-phosphate dehydratase [Archaeoglobus veneficus SNP6]|uniref:Imidazoleglycerol-phosphate dehydratase n=2 Tax=Archaeoglobus veneficus TaxID=58290 RepID=F2KQX5_ARCVS|nr:imidazoleglycerol-phosphate dehydratase HisB [Archaeoglobus veneficus]AEA47781.1 Imidazoleglycerol-phosphate dehydratase [Archaeoglobus veneficus SNP6]